MSSIFTLELPWHSLRSKLAKLNSAGLVEYNSTFDDFKLHLKHNPEDDPLLTEALYRNKESLETIFRVIDKDHSGFISMDEFEEACQLLGQHTASVIPREHVIAMARNMDLNKDGQIDFNEFLETFRIVDQFGRDLVARRASEDASIAGTDET